MAERGVILAAGFGTRLKPITDHVPKPLLPVGGISLLDRIIARFDEAGIGDLAVNAHHHAGQIVAHLKKRPDNERFEISVETEILGTGGALHQLEDYLAQADDFVLHNGDVYCDADLEELLRVHRASGALATLAVVDWPPINSVRVDDHGAVLDFGSAVGEAGWTYTGIGAFRADLLGDIGPGFSSLIDPLVRAITRNPGSVRAWQPETLDWSDLGTIGSYLSAQKRLEGVENASAGGPRITPIAGQGSDRRFWRLELGQPDEPFSAIGMLGPVGDPDFRYMTELGTYLEKRGWSIPRILATDPERDALLMSDGGRSRLFDLVTDPSYDENTLERHYLEAVEHLVDLAVLSGSATGREPDALARRLDQAGLRWETDYFTERFLVGHVGLDEEDARSCEDEFDALAEKVAGYPQTWIHRDYQSQNLMVSGGGVCVVDFQGMRTGPVGYDLASVLWDPYVEIPETLRTDMTDRYTSGLASRWIEAAVWSAPEIEAMVLGCALQRLMQALGAYGFLGHVKGKPEFLNHIPRGVAHLRELMGLADRQRSRGTREARALLPRPMPGLAALIAAVDP